MHPFQRRLAAVLIGGIITVLVVLAPSSVRGSERDLLTHFMVNQQARTLPNTAGELTLVGLIGMLCFGAGIGLKVLLRKP